jgi:UDP-N-acetylmuramate dehydrogenase
VSTKHANFIPADPGAAAADVATLVAEVRRRVADATGLVLQTELRMVGFDDGTSP